MSLASPSSSVAPLSVGILPPTRVKTANELFGAVAPDRLRQDLPFGAATEADLIRINESSQGLCELVDGVLVEKIMGLEESGIAYRLGVLIGVFLASTDWGEGFGADGMMRLAPGLLRVPDLSVIAKHRLPKPGERGAAFDGGPDLAVEVISPGNTKQEMDQKLEDFFAAGVREVWYVYPREQTIHVFASTSDSREWQLSETLDNSAVLVGFKLPLDRLFL